MKEETLIIVFAKQESSDTTFYSCNLRRGNFDKLNLEAKKIVEQILELKNKMECNYYHEKATWTLGARV